MYLSGLPYQRANCMSECRQQHMLHYCNCTVDFFYPSGLYDLYDSIYLIFYLKYIHLLGIYPACNITGLMCLTRYNGVLSFSLSLLIDSSI